MSTSNDEILRPISIMSKSETATGPHLQENMDILTKRWDTLAIIFHNNSISTDLNLKIHNQSPTSL